MLEGIKKQEKKERKSTLFFFHLAFYNALSRYGSSPRVYVWLLEFLLADGVLVSPVATLKQIVTELPVFLFGYVGQVSVAESYGGFAVTGL